MATGKRRSFAIPWRRVMNFEVDDLLDHVDEWKFKLHEKRSEERRVGKECRL